MSLLIDKEYLLEVLPDFKRLPEDSLDSFIEQGEFLNFLSGCQIFSSDTVCDFVFIILSGNVKVYSCNKFGGSVLLGPGDFFDLASFFTQKTSEFSFFSHGHVEMYSWSGSSINALLDEHPHMYSFFSAMMVKGIERFHQEEILSLQSKFNSNAELNKEPLSSLLSRKEDECETLYEVGQVLNSFENIDNLFQAIVDIVPQALKAKGCILRLIDESESVLKIRAASGLPEHIIASQTQRIGDGVAGWVAKTGMPALINDISKDSRFSNNVKSIVTSLISTPLKNKGRIIGTLTLFDKCNSYSPDFTASDIKTLTTITNQIALTLENLQLSNKIDFAQENWRIALKEKLTLIKKTPVLRKLFPDVMSAAKATGGIAILGEEGSGKLVIAEAVHYFSLRRKEEFVYVDCSKIPKNSMGEEIFGWEEFGKKEKLSQGSLEKAHRGTICFDNFEYLNRMNQLKLLNLLRKQFFIPVGRNVKKTSDVKLIFLSSKSSQELFSCDFIMPEILNHFKNSVIKVPSLRERKRDLPLLIDYFIKKISAQRHCELKKLSPEALGLLLNYDWPGNIDELESVLSRAVILAEKETLNQEHIMFGLPGVEKKDEFNVLRIPFVRKIFESRFYPDVFQMLSLILSALIIYSSFFGTHVVEENFALWICWSVGWPLLFLSFIFMGRIWCGICPFSFVAGKIKKKSSIQLETPKWIQDKKNWLGFVFCLFLIWFERVTHIYTSRQFTGSLLLMILVGAVVFASIFKRRIWCLYICPWGALNRILSACSLTAIRANHNICYSKCKDHACYLGKDGNEGCSMGQHPYKLDMKNCVLCGNCIKNCDYKSILLGVRPLGRNLWKWSDNYLSDSLLGISLASVLILERFMAMNFYTDLVPGFMLRYDILFYSVFFVLVVLFSYIFLLLMGKLMGESEKESAAFSAKTGYAFIPMPMFGYLVFYTPAIHKNIHALLLALGMLLSFYTMHKILSFKHGKFREKSIIFGILLLYLTMYCTVLKQLLS